MESGRAKPPAYSMRPRTSGAESNLKSPGPGSYDPRVDYAKENLGQVKIGTSTRNSIKSLAEVPGPGQYTVGGSLGGPAFGIGSSNRNDGSSMKTKQYVPGPGAYHVPTHIANLPRYIMPDRPDSLRYL